MFKSRHFSYLTGLLFFVFSIATHAQPQEKILKKNTLNAQQKVQFCRQFESFCVNGKVSNLFQVEGQKNQFYVIDELRLAHIDLQNNNFNLLDIWDFSTYQPRTQSARWAVFEQSEDNKQLSIFPKLFPINENDYAVGIVQKWQEGYSGGGMNEEVVDFLQLKVKSQYQQVFQNIPLSMYRMIRACFSEEDYQQSRGKCHDEYTLNSQIFYVKPYTWRVKYHYQADYSPTSDSGTRPINQYKTYLLNDNREDAIQLPKGWD